jgi:hypothetical protein
VFRNLPHKMASFVPFNMLANITLQTILAGLNCAPPYCLAATESSCNTNISAVQTSAVACFADGTISFICKRVQSRASPMCDHAVTVAIAVADAVCHYARGYHYGTQCVERHVKRGDGRHGNGSWQRRQRNVVDEHHFWRVGYSECRTVLDRLLARYRRCHLCFPSLPLLVVLLVVSCYSFFSAWPSAVAYCGGVIARAVLPMPTVRVRQ